MAINGSAKVDAAKLVVDYRLTNTSSTRIFVWDMMVKHGEEDDVLAPTLAYVSWEEPATVRLARAMLPLPPDFEITFKEMPFVHALQPQAATEGHIVLSVPVQEYSPYYPPPDRVRRVGCTRIHLIIGWVEEKPGMILSSREVSGSTALALRGGWEPPLQRWEELKLDAAVPLDVRLNEFDRRPPLC